MSSVELSAEIVCGRDKDPPAGTKRPTNEDGFARALIVHFNPTWTEQQIVEAIVVRHSKKTGRSEYVVAV